MTQVERHGNVTKLNQNKSPGRAFALKVWYTKFCSQDVPHEVQTKCIIGDPHKKALSLEKEREEPIHKTNST